jgi:hypothetical protein
MACGWVLLLFFQGVLQKMENKGKYKKFEIFKDFLQKAYK